MLRAMSAASPRTPRPGREFGARGGPGSAGDRAGGAARGWSGTPRGSSVAYPNISAGPSNFHRDTGCRSERPRRPVTLTVPLIAHARVTGGGPERPVDFAPRYCYADSNEMSSGTLVLATCPTYLPHPECGPQDTVGICLEGSRPASSLAGCAADGFGFLPQHLFRTLVPQAVVRVFSRFLLLLLHACPPLFRTQSAGYRTHASASAPVSRALGPLPRSRAAGRMVIVTTNTNNGRENSQDGCALVGPRDPQA
jgi:hypothetical protein